MLIAERLVETRDKKETNDEKLERLCNEEDAKEGAVESYTAGPAGCNAIDRQAAAMYPWCS